MAGGVDTLDPELSEVALDLSAADVGIFPGMEDLLFSGFEE